MLLLRCASKRSNDSSGSGTGRDKLRLIGLEFRPLPVHKTLEPEAVAAALGVGEVRQDLGDGEAIGRRFPPRILRGEFARQSAQNLRRGFQLPDGRESVVFDLSILQCSPQPRHTVAGKCGLISVRAPGMFSESDRRRATVRAKEAGGLVRR